MKAMEKLLANKPHHAVYGRTYQETSSSLHFQIEEVLLERLTGIYNIYLVMRHSKIHTHSDT